MSHREIRLPGTPLPAPALPASDKPKSVANRGNWGSVIRNEAPLPKAASDKARMAAFGMGLDVAGNPEGEVMNRMSGFADHGDHNMRKLSKCLCIPVSGSMKSTERASSFSGADTSSALHGSASG